MTADPVTSAEVPELLRLDGIGKTFGPNTVLHDISLTMQPGRVHALVGQNGAGKSTLGKIIGGVYSADTGELTVAGVRATGWNARKALNSGVATIQQELSLVPDQTVAENVFLGVERHRWGLLAPGLRQRYEKLEQQCRLGLDPRALVGDLRIADQQKVEIMRALSRDAQVIVMDEPTSSLTADEVERLHDIIVRLKTEGRLVIYVTHFLDAVLSVCDDLTILRDGKHVRTAPTASETQESIVEAMLGRATDVAYPPKPPMPPASTTPLLELRGAHSAHGVNGVDLVVRPGEIVGLAGLVGSGRTEVARLIYGTDSLVAGEMILAEQKVGRSSPRRSIRAGVVLIPEDRKKQGLVLTQDVQSNIGLPIAGRGSRWSMVSPRQERSVARDLVDKLDIRPARVRHPVATMSGGNQQKVLFAKWMTVAPRLVLLDEPTRGVDVGARLQIYRLIHELAASGTGILLISSELEEVFGLAHRIYTLRDGATTGEIDPATDSPDDVLYSLFGVTRQRRPQTTENA